MNEPIKKMAELLRSGATMLQDTCPVCKSPLFRLKDRILCAKCGTYPSDATSTSPRSDKVKETLFRVNSTVLERIEELEIEISKTTDLDKLSQLGKLTLIFLRILRLLNGLGEHE